MRIRMILSVLALALSACANEPVDKRAVHRDTPESSTPATAINRGESSIARSVNQALALEGLHNVTVRIDGQDVVLGGWVYSPEDMVRAHHVVQSVYGVDEVDFLGIRVG